MKKKTPLLIAFILSVVFCGFSGIANIVAGLSPKTGQGNPPPGLFAIGLGDLAVVAFFAWLYFRKSTVDSSAGNVPISTPTSTPTSVSQAATTREKINLNEIIIIFGSLANEFGLTTSKTVTESGWTKLLIQGDKNDQKLQLQKIPLKTIPVVIANSANGLFLDDLKIYNIATLLFADYFPDFPFNSEEDQNRAYAYFDKTLNNYNNMLLSGSPSYSFDSNGENGAFFLTYTWKSGTEGFFIQNMAEMIEKAFKNYPQELHQGPKPTGTEMTEKGIEAKIEDAPQISPKGTPEGVVIEDRVQIKKLLDNLTAIKKGMPVSDLTARFGEPAVTINQAAAMGMFGNMTVIGDTSGLEKKENWVFKTKYGEFQAMVQGEVVVDMIFVNPLIEKLKAML